jgi:hypothetical protein
MTSRSQEPIEFLFLPILLALIFVFGAAALVWVSQVRTSPEPAAEAELPAAGGPPRAAAAPNEKAPPAPPPGD